MLWAALAVAVSPLIASAPTWLSERPESHYVLFAPVLLAWETWRTEARERRPQRALGVLCAGTSPALILLGLESGSPTLGLGGAALGFIGVAAWTGRPHLPTALLALWALPVPVFVLEHLSPGLESAWMTTAVAVVSKFGLELQQTGPVAFGVDGARVEFFAIDDGLLLAHGMALIGFWSGLRRDDAAPRCVARTLAFALVGFGLQALVLIAATGMAAAGDAETALSVLVRGPTCIVAIGIAVVTAFESRQRQRSRKLAPAPHTL